MIYKEMLWYYLFLYTLSPFTNLCYLKCFLFQRYLLAFSLQIQIQFEFYFHLRLISFSFLCSPYILSYGKMPAAADLHCLAYWPFMAHRPFFNVCLKLYILCFSAGFSGPSFGSRGVTGTPSVRSFQKLPISDKNNPWLLCVTKPIRNDGNISVITYLRWEKKVTVQM